MDAPPSALNVSESRVDSAYLYGHSEEKGVRRGRGQVHMGSLGFKDFREVLDSIPCSAARNPGLWNETALLLFRDGSDVRSYGSRLM